MGDGVCQRDCHKEPVPCSCCPSSNTQDDACVDASWKWRHRLRHYHDCPIASGQPRKGTIPGTELACLRWERSPSIRTVRGMRSWAWRQHVDWKVASRLVTIGEQLPLGTRPSGACLISRAIPNPNLVARESSKRARRKTAVVLRTTVEAESSGGHSSRRWRLGPPRPTIRERRDTRIGSREKEDS